MNLVSLVLYGTQARYWFTLLPAIVANLEAYKGFSIRLYVTSDVRSHPVSGILDELSDCLPFQVFEIPGAYKNQEPSMWRLRPLWEPVETILCRDVDSLPTTDEVKAVRLWQSTGYPIHSIRSYHLHDTLLMAGLCGFRPRLLQFLRDHVTSFDHYVELYRRHATQNPDFNWGCDQEALRMLCCGTAHQVFDCPIGDCKPHHPAALIPTAAVETIQATYISNVNPELLRLCDVRMSEMWGEFPGFAGRPIGDARSELHEFLKLDLGTSAPVRKILENNADYRKFFTP
jgi:hypothetical protein